MTELDKPKLDDEYISQNDIVKRYLQNKLTPEETVEFEEYMLDKPELLERLELDMVLVETLQKVSDSQCSSEQPNTNWWNSLFSHTTTVAVCAALFTLLWYRTSDPMSELNFSPSIVYLENYRSADNSITLFFEKNETFKIMVVDIPPYEQVSNTQAFEVNFRDINNELTLVQSVSANNNAEVTVLLFADKLSHGAYILNLLQGGKIIANFNINVQKSR